MNFRRSLAVAVVVLLAIAVLSGITPALPATPLSVWVAPESQKVKLDASVGGASYVWSPSANKVTVKGARNEYLAFQVIIHASGAGLTGVNAQVSDLRGSAGTIVRGNVSLFREHYLHVTEPSTSMYGSPSSDGAGWYPDALVPFSSPVM